MYTKNITSRALKKKVWKKVQRRRENVEHTKNDALGLVSFSRELDYQVPIELFNLLFCPKLGNLVVHDDFPVHVQVLLKTDLVASQVVLVHFR